MVVKDNGIFLVRARRRGDAESGEQPGSGLPASQAIPTLPTVRTVPTVPTVPTVLTVLIKPFRTAAAFERWLEANHAREPEIWVRIYKKASGIPTVTYAEALDSALCWGWIDGLKKGLDEESFLQRFTPRRRKSIWSQVNREHVARLVGEGRMRAPGQLAVDAAKADGRWDAAYAPIRSASEASIPADLRAAIEASPRARAMFRTLNRANLFALGFRTGNMKTPAGRAKKIAALVAMLARGETIVPERPRAGSSAGDDRAR